MKLHILGQSDIAAFVLYVDLTVPCVAVSATFVLFVVCMYTGFVFLHLCSNEHVHRL